MLILASLTPQFISQNLHFAINLLLALACFAAGWLYFDADDKHHPIVKVAKWTGFFLLAVGFLAAGASGDDTGPIATAAVTLKLFGYIGILLSNFLDPIQPRPATTGLLFSSWRESTPAPGPTTTINSTPPPKDTTIPDQTTRKRPATLSAGLAIPMLGFSFALPLASLLAAGLYWRRATIGLERHIRGVAIAFTTLAASHLLDLTGQWQTSDNPLLQQLVQPLGPVWLVHHAILLGGGLLLLRWVSHYLIKRPQTQLFLFVTSLGASIVLVITLTITSLLLLNLQKSALTSLQTSAKVLGYTIDGKTADTRADAGIIAQNPALLAAITSIPTSAASHSTLTTLLPTLTASTHFTELIVTDTYGQVLLRASDPSRYGDSLSANSLVKRALSGQTTSGVTSQAGAVTPALVVTTAQPVRTNSAIAGVVLASQPLDNAFVDAIKRTTGLDSTLYAGAVRTATTLTNANSQRSIGARESHATVLATVLKHGQAWNGPLDISNQPYLMTYLPVKDADATTVGMLAVGQPQADLLQTSATAIKLTFLAAIIWLTISILPIYFICRTIGRQLH